MTTPRTLRGKKRKGRKQQNHVVLQQLGNGQFLVTLPRLWTEILGLEKGDVVTFVPGAKGGIELLPSRLTSSSAYTTESKKAQHSDTKKKHVGASKKNRLRGGLHAN